MIVKSIERYVTCGIFVKSIRKFAQSLLLGLCATISSEVTAFAECVTMHYNQVGNQTQHSLKDYNRDAGATQFSGKRYSAQGTARFCINGNAMTDASGEDPAHYVVFGQREHYAQPTPQGTVAQVNVLTTHSGTRFTFDRQFTIETNDEKGRNYLQVHSLVVFMNDGRTCRLISASDKKNLGMRWNAYIGSITGMNYHSVGSGSCSVE